MPRRLIPVIFAALALRAAALPAGTPVRVRLGQTISSAIAQSGDTWEGKLASDLVLNGKTVARRGAPVQGKVAEAKASGRLASPGLLKLSLVSVQIDGVDEPVLSN